MQYRAVLVAVVSVFRFVNPFHHCNFVTESHIIGRTTIREVGESTVCWCPRCRKNRSLKGVNARVVQSTKNQSDSKKARVNGQRENQQSDRPFLSSAHFDSQLTTKMTERVGYRKFP